MTEIKIRLAFVVCLFGVKVFGQDPEITREILPDIKRQGETGTLNCTVTRQQNYKVYWSHGDISITSDDKIDIDSRLNEVVNGFRKYDIMKTRNGEMSTYTLIIRRLLPIDAGIYICAINVKGASSANNPVKTGKMIVLSPPVLLQATTTMTVTVKEGDNVTLNCEAIGYPKPNVTWMRVNGAPLPAPINKVRYTSPVLNMVSVHRADRGLYRCIADNTVRPPARSDVKVFVNFRPFARPVQSSYGQAQNRMYDLVIECRIQGYPEPDLQWYKASNRGFWTRVNEDDKHKVHVLLNHGNLLEMSEYWFQLHIVNVQAGDYGNYICEGKNKYGTDHGTVNVFETSECQGANCPWVSSFKGGAMSVRAVGGTSILIIFFLPFLRY